MEKNRQEGDIDFPTYYFKRMGYGIVVGFLRAMLVWGGSDVNVQNALEEAVTSSNRLHTEKMLQEYKRRNPIINFN